MESSGIVMNRYFQEESFILICKYFRNLKARLDMSNIPEEINRSHTDLLATLQV